MKWIKVAIGAVIAVLSIGIIATTVYKMTQPSEVIKEVSFEVDYDEGKYYPISAYDEIVEYGVFEEEEDFAINLVLIYVNEIAEELFYIQFARASERIYFSGYIHFPDGVINIDNYMDTEGNWVDVGGTLTDNVNIKLVFEVTQPPQLTGINATLILLIPLVFVGGLLLYFYKPLKKD